MLLNCGVGEDSCESLGLQGDPTSPSSRKSVLNIHWKGWWWSWNSNTLANWWEELTHWKRPWCWERLKVGEGDDRGWDGWIASLTQWTWVWVNSRSWWWTGRSGVLQSMGSQRVRHDGATELNWSLWLCGSQQTVKIFQEMGMPDLLTCLLRNLCAGQEETVRTGHGIMDWFQIGKGVRQGGILSPCLFNLYA